jgi:hypothetical protein
VDVIMMPPPEKLDAQVITMRCSVSSGLINCAS